MKYELSEKEIQHIERYRNLTEEFQTALDSQIQVLFDLQSSVVKGILQAK